jgi:integrase
LAKKKSVKPNIYLDENAKGNPYWIQFMIDGKRHTKRGFASIGEAQKYITSKQNQINNGGYVEPSKMKFKDYFKDWLSIKTDISEETKVLYTSYLKVHIEPFFKDILLTKLTANHIQKFISELHSKNLADNTIKRIFSTVNTCLNTAEKMDDVIKNVSNKVDKPKVRKKKINAWDEDTVFKVVDELLNDRRYGIVIYLAIMTGMRRGEILGLRWKDVDFKNKAFNIQQTLTPKRRIKDTTKTDGSSRSVTITPETFKVLEAHKINIDNEKREHENYHDNNLVICNKNGKPVSGEHVYRYWKWLVEKYELPVIKFRDLRHTHASLLLKQGVHAKIVSERLGHSSVNITLDTYSHILPNIQDEIVKGFDDMIYKRKKENESADQ